MDDQVQLLQRYGLDVDQVRIKSVGRIGAISEVDVKTETVGVAVNGETLICDLDDLEIIWDG